MNIIKGAKYKVLGSSDFPVCDCCGKTNLTRAVILETEFEEVFNVGVICASKLLKQTYMNKTHKISAEAVMAKAKRVKKEKTTEYLVGA